MSPSTFTWLQFDEEQCRRARELVRALSEPGTLDSLGIGTIRDGFANILFPGTSTIQTRVRYFLLVPWAIQHVQAGRPRTWVLYDKRLRDVEVAMIRSLKATQPVPSGIIGVDREERTRNLASTVYWTGTAAWGIRVAGDVSRSDVRDAALTQRQVHRNDDGEGSPLIIWDDLPGPPDGFPNEPLAILPTADEADYLLSKMVTTRRGPARCYRVPTCIPLASESVTGHRKLILLRRFSTVVAFSRRWVWTGVHDGHAQFAHRGVLRLVADRRRPGGADRAVG